MEAMFSVLIAPDSDWEIAGVNFIHSQSVVTVAATQKGVLPKEWPESAVSKNRAIFLV